MLLNGYRVLLWNDGNVLELERGGVVQHCGCTNYLCIAPFKTVNFLLHEFHLNKLLKKKKHKKQKNRQQGAYGPWTIICQFLLQERE